MQSHTLHIFVEEQTQTQTPQTKANRERYINSKQTHKVTINMPEHRERKGEKTHRHHHLPSFFDEQTKRNEECPIAPLMMMIVCLLFAVQRQPFFLGDFVSYTIWLFFPMLHPTIASFTVYYYSVLPLFRLRVIIHEGEISIEKKRQTFIHFLLSWASLEILLTPSLFYSPSCSRQSCADPTSHFAKTLRKHRTPPFFYFFFQRPTEHSTIF